MQVVLCNQQFASSIVQAILCNGESTSCSRSRRSSSTQVKYYIGKYYASSKLQVLILSSSIMHVLC